MDFQIFFKLLLLFLFYSLEESAFRGELSTKSKCIPVLMDRFDSCVDWDLLLWTYPLKLFVLSLGYHSTLVLLYKIFMSIYLWLAK